MARPAASPPSSGGRLTPAPARGWLRAPRRSGLWSLGLYGALALLMFGVPVLDDPRHEIIAADEVDSSVFMWFYGWWPHALLNGLNPFVTDYQFAPEGFNLQWATSVPLPSILLAPVTLALGPVVTWNIVQLAAPALNAWTAFLLCRRVSGRVAPSLVGGYIFGFSPYVLLHLTGGPNAALVALVPVLVLLVLLRLEGSVSERRFVVAFTATVVAQYLISNELLATSTLFGGVALVAAYAIFAERRRELRRVALLLVGCFVAAGVVLAPFLGYFVFGDHYPPGATQFAAALVNVALPPDLTGLTHVLGLSYPRSSAQTYVGLPLIVLVAAFAWQRRNSRVAWLLLACLAAALIASLGDELALRGRGLADPFEGTGIPLPWALFSGLPVLSHATPGRFAMFVTLAAALIASLWLTRGGWLRWALAALVIVAILPDFNNKAWNTPISDPQFIASGSYRDQLDRQDRVLTIPAWGPNERWQANADFDFRLAGGYLGNPFPPSYTRFSIWSTLVSGRLQPGYARELRRFVDAKGVTAIVVDKRYPGPWRRLFDTLGVEPVDTGGVLLYRL